MTEAQLRRRVAYWMKKLEPLGLAHYEFEVSIVEGLEDDEGFENLANVSPSDSYDFFTLCVDAALLEDDLEKIDRVLIHELVHVPVHRLICAAQHVEDYLPTAAGQLWGKQLTHEMEVLVERLARTIYAAHGS